MSDDARAEYTMVTDESGHRYYIPIAKIDDWRAWEEKDDEDGWEPPDYAVRIDGGYLIFQSPRIGDLD